MKLNLKLLWSDVVKHESLEDHGKYFWIGDKPRPLDEVGLGVAEGALHSFDQPISEVPLKTSIDVNFSAFLYLWIDRSSQLETTLGGLGVANSLALKTLEPLFHLVVKDHAWIGRAVLFLGLHHLVDKVEEVLGCVLLLSRLEFRVSFADKSLEHLRPAAILVVLVRSVIFNIFLCFLSQNGLRVSAR